MKLGNLNLKQGLVALSLLGSAALPQVAKASLDPFVGEIMLVAFDFCPRGFAQANGQLVAISSNQALFALYGTFFGGDGRTTFALPDLRGRIVVGTGSGSGLPSVSLGQQSGSTTQSMTVNTMPAHSHVVNANNLDGDKPGPGGKLLAAAPTGGTGNETIYTTVAPNVTMNPSMIAPTGSGAPINTEDPKLALTYCIATQGIFPSRP